MSNQISVTKEGFAGAFRMGCAFASPFFRSNRVRWGATDNEISRSMPGDSIIKKPKWQYTQAITIQAPIDKVWPWLVQIGQGRGGFYSYQMLENLVGCNIHNADRVIPEYQHLAPGDNIMLHPKAPLPVTEVETGRSIVLHYDSRTGQPEKSDTQPKDFFESSWLFLLDPVNDRKTRLISRFRIDYSPGIRNKVSLGMFGEPIYSTMQTQMLRGIKRRVEGGSGQSLFSS
jgi:hypothetical protein